MEKRWMLSRRELLRGFGALGLASLIPRNIVYADSPAPTRFVVVHVPEGMWTRAPRPAAGATNLGQILDALQPWQSKLLVLNNLSIQSMSHGPGGDGHHRAVPHMLTCTEMQDENNAGGASVDQKIAQAIGGSSRFASLQFAVRIVYGDTNSKPLWSGPGRVVAANQSPWDAFNRIFSGSQTSTVMSTGTTMKPPFDMRKSVLDRSLKDISALRARLSAPDRVLLDTYQDSLRDIEMRLQNTAAPTAGASCTPPTLGASMDIKAEPNYPTIGKLQMDTLVASLQCGATRVASLQWGNSNDQCTYSWLDLNTLGHDMSHNTNDCDPSNTKKLQTFQWYSEQAAYLMNKLNSVPEGNGTMLDNTLVLWVSEFGESAGHSGDNLMWLLLGNVAGTFKSGRVLDCGGHSVSDLHTSICNAFGIADTTFGNPAYCKGPLPNLTA